jgi:hypothetical protein
MAGIPRGKEKKKKGMSEPLIKHGVNREPCHTFQSFSIG